MDINCEDEDCILTRYAVGTRGQPETLGPHRRPTRGEFCAAFRAYAESGTTKADNKEHCDDRGEGNDGGSNIDEHKGSLQQETPAPAATQPQPGRPEMTPVHIGPKVDLPALEPASVSQETADGMLEEQIKDKKRQDALPSVTNTTEEKVQRMLEHPNVTNEAKAKFREMLAKTNETATAAAGEARAAAAAELNALEMEAAEQETAAPNAAEVRRSSGGAVRTKALAVPTAERAADAEAAAEVAAADADAEAAMKAATVAEEATLTEVAAADAEA